jgi:Protein of unknown function (DUF1559)
MSMRWFLGLAVAAGSMGAAGCGNPPGFYTVSDKVLYKGEPASGAVVYFHRADNPPSGGQGIPFGIANQNGGFDLTCDGYFPIPGMHNACLQAAGMSQTYINAVGDNTDSGTITNPQITGTIRMAAITDGTSNTMMVAECCGRPAGYNGKHQIYF